MCLINCFHQYGNSLHFIWLVDRAHILLVNQLIPRGFGDQMLGVVRDCHPIMQYQHRMVSSVPLTPGWNIHHDCCPGDGLLVHHINKALISKGISLGSITLTVDNLEAKASRFLQLKNLFPCSLEETGYGIDDVDSTINLHWHPF